MIKELKSLGKIKKDLEGKTLFALKAEIDSSNEEKKESYLLLYKESPENTILINEEKNPEIFEKYVKNFIKKYKVSIETKRKPHISRFDYSRKNQTIYDFFK